MLAIRADRAFDGSAFVPAATVLVDGARILSASSGAADLPDGCELREYPGCTVLPGLIDAHVHLVADSADAALDRVAGYSDAGLDAVMTDSLRRSLAAGVTTVRDLGDRQFSALLRRDPQSAVGHGDGLPITAHAHALAAVEQALRAGVDGIEHCSCLTEHGPQITDDLLDRLAASEIVVGGALGSLKEGFVNPGAQALATMQRMGTTPEQFIVTLRESTARMLRAGVRLIASTDAGISAHKPHGSVHRAVSDLVDAGASVESAVAAATSGSAEACGLADRKGRLREGFDADLLIVDGDLSTDVAALAAVRSVVLRGCEVPA
ncbi:MAG: amidohydrolase family protein [Jatrophihabitans sp.]